MHDRADMTPEQVEILLRGINPVRVLSRKGGGKTLHYLAAADVRAHAIRLFGYGQFSIDTQEVETLFEEQVPTKDGKSTNWYVGVRAIVCLHVHQTHATYTEAAVGGSKQPERHEALDMATKTAVSDAMKRCFINLGDQFGLSLYFNGQTAGVVKGLVHTPKHNIVTTDGEVIASAELALADDADLPAPAPEA